MSFKQLSRSFQDAYRGLLYTFRYELSFRIQTVAAIVVLFFAFYLHLRIYEKVVIILLAAMVLILELVNSVLERVIDLFQPRINHVAKVIKDIMAGAVLLAAIVSVVIAWLILGPHLKLLIVRILSLIATNIYS